MAARRRGELRPLGGGRARWANGLEIQLIPPELGDRSFTAEALLGVLDAHRVERAVLLQGSFYGFQNEYSAEAARVQPGYILVVEGAIPTGASGKYCRLWPGLSMADGLPLYAANAAYIIALGTCASYGGVSGGAPNPTTAKGVSQVIGNDPRLINVPGCPANPDWLVGTITYLLTNNQVPPLDANRRPLLYFGRRVHDDCFNRHKLCGQPVLAGQLSSDGCMEYLGCKGKKTYSDCPMRRWNSSGPGQFGVNWCIGARSPCLGCVNPTFPDGMSPFYVYSPTP